MGILIGVFLCTRLQNVIFQDAFVTGYLRLKRRYRILCVIRDLKTAKAYIQPSNKLQLQKLQSVSISHTPTHKHMCMLICTNAQTHLAYI